ncbi:single-stranded DNA-binding protein [Dactylosporangium sp. NPDC051541]|uniref:single-stranded DNA-binding protein n=1 Tax=Dactylosporangium sp. NPDC051541 TaxID=3363977 RepID=UPI00379BCC28
MSGEISVTVVGNLTADPELRFLPDGKAMARFSVASTPRRFDQKTGGYADGKATFMRCTVFGPMAEHMAESLNKGTRVVVSGRLEQSQWQTDEGDKRSAIGMLVDEIGPSLRFATAKVQKLTRSGGGDGFVPSDPPDDPWNSAAPAGASTTLRAV